MKMFRSILVCAIFFTLCCCKKKADNWVEKQMEVTVTAYNTVPWQTKAIDPDIAAWGDTLKPGMKAIAVSRDLMAYGLRKGMAVAIEGLEGEYIVLDKMNRRYRKRIDIYMELDIQAAREWGKQKRTITWKVERDSKFDRYYQYSGDDENS